jgi:hypothetical protein
MQRRKTIGNSFGFIEPSESRLGRDTDALNYPNGPYSSECVEGEFCELRLLGLLRSSRRRRAAGIMQQSRASLKRGGHLL